MNPARLSIGYSPCPNDTFIFHALVSGLLPGKGFDLEEPLLADVETLNGWAFEERLDITKLSFHAYGHLRHRYRLLSSGAALGRGCGPLLVARQSMQIDELTEATIAIPGKYTTAAMLLKLYNPGGTKLQEMSFETIMPAVAEGRVDAGVIIHESRFTYEQQGLILVTDLGQWWEEISGCPIPLGGIAVRRSLGRKTAAAVQEAIRQSVSLALAEPGRSLPYIRQHAQELDQQVIESHIGLYVNDFSVNLGEEGERAVQEFLRQGEEAAVFSPSTEEIFI